MATASGIVAVYDFEKDNEFGLSVASFLKDTFVQVALPLLLLIWLGIYTICQQASKPESRERIGNFYRALASRFEPLTHEPQVESLIADSTDTSPIDAALESEEVIS